MCTNQGMCDVLRGDERGDCAILDRAKQSGHENVADVAMWGTISHLQGYGARRKEQ
jgi:hypothetical protein